MREGMMGKTVMRPYTFTGLDFLSSQISLSVYLFTKGWSKAMFELKKRQDGRMQSIRPSCRFFNPK